MIPEPDRQAAEAFVRGEPVIDTPRTDEDVRLCKVISQSFGPMVGADFARKLERELNSSRAIMDSAAYSGYGKSVTAEIERLQAERDAWQACAEALVKVLYDAKITNLNPAVATYEQLKGE